MVLAAIFLGIAVVALLRYWPGLQRPDSEKKQKACQDKIEQILRAAPGHQVVLMVEAKKEFGESLIYRILEERIKSEPSPADPGLVKLAESLGYLDHCMERLKQEKEWVARARAAEILGRLAHPAAVGPLIEAITNPAEEMEIKSIATKALTQMRDPKALDYLIAGLTTDDPGLGQILSDALVRFGEAGLGHLTEAFQKSTDANQRLWIIKILGALARPETIALVITALEDHNSRVRETAAAALGQLKAADAAAALRERLLYDPVNGVRAAAAQSLGRIADNAALRALGQAILEAEDQTRHHATEALYQMGEPAAALFLEILDRGDAKAATLAATGLERIGYVQSLIDDLGASGKEKTALEILLKIAQTGVIEVLTRSLLDKKKSHLRLGLLKIFKKINNPRSFEALIEVGTSDPDSDVRFLAVETLIALGEEKAVPVILATLKNDERNRATILQSLSLFSTATLSSIAQEILPYVQNREPSVREAAAIAIGFVPGKKSLDSLLLALKDAAPAVRARAAHALGRRSGGGPQNQESKQAAQALTAALEDPDAGVRRSAVQSLGSFGWPQLINPLAQAFEKADDSYRDDIADALSKIAPDDIFSALSKIPVNHPKIRTGIAWTLGLMADERGYQTLVKFLQDKEPAVRAAAAGGLGNFRSRETAEMLKDYLEDPNERVRAAVVNALAKSQAPMAAEVLTKRLSDPDPFVQRRAVLAIGILGGLRPETERSSFKTRLKDWLNGHQDEPPSRAAALLGLAFLEDKSMFQESFAALHNAELGGLCRYMLQTLPFDVRHRLFESLALDMTVYLTTSGNPARTSEHYVNVLRSSRKTTDRLQALAALAVLKSQAAGAAFSETFVSDPDPKVRAKALASLLQFSSQPKLLELIARAVRDPDEIVREAAIEILKQLNHKELKGSKELLISIINISDPKARQAVATLAARVFEGAEQDLLAHSAPGQNKNKILGILTTLGLIGTAVTRKAFSPFLNDPDPDIRATAIYWATHNGLLAPQELLTYLNDPQEMVRLAALKGLGEHLDNEILTALIPLAEDPATAIRSQLAFILGQKKLPDDERPKSLLKKLAHDPHIQVKAQSLLGLFRIGQTQVAPLAAETLEQISASERKELVEHLERGGLILELEKIIKQDSNTQRRKEALRIFAALDIEMFLHYLLAALKDPSSDIRRETVHLLAQLKDPKIREAIEALANDPAETVRTAVKWIKLQSGQL